MGEWRRGQPAGSLGSLPCAFSLALNVLSVSGVSLVVALSQVAVSPLQRCDGGPQFSLSYQATETSLLHGGLTIRPLGLGRVQSGRRLSVGEKASLKDTWCQTHCDSGLNGTRGLPPTVIMKARHIIGIVRKSLLKQLNFSWGELEAI